MLLRILFVFSINKIDLFEIVPLSSKSSTVICLINNFSNIASKCFKSLQFEPDELSWEKTVFGKQKCKGSLEEKALPSSKAFS